MTTRNLRRMYFACSWFVMATPVLVVIGFLCGAFSVWTAVRAWPVWLVVALQLAAMAGGEYAFRALRRRGTHPWE